MPAESHLSAHFNRSRTRIRGTSRNEGLNPDLEPPRDPGKPENVPFHLPDSTQPGRILGSWAGNPTHETREADSRAIGGSDNRQLSRKSDPPAGSGPGYS